MSDGGGGRHLDLWPVARSAVAVPILLAALPRVRAAVSFAPAFVLAVVLGGFAGCGGGDFAAPPCAESPSVCGAGRTCWLNAAQTDYVCLNSGSGQAGDACQLTPGVPTCGDGLVCYSVVAGPSPVCTPACSPTDSTATCPDGRQCTAIQGPKSAGLFYACAP